MSELARGGEAATFVRVEEVLLPARDVRAALHLALEAPGLGGRLGRLSLVAAALPALGLAGWADRRLGRRLALLPCRGLGRDRCELLLREHAERDLAPRLRADGLALVERARAEGRRVVLVASGLDEALRPALRPALALAGEDALVASRLEYDHDVATGRLVEGRRQGWVEALARARGIDLRRSVAYGTDVEDEPLLRAVLEPCAVNPDARLERIARAEGWPVLEVD